MDWGEIAALLAIVMGVVYLAVEVRQKLSSNRRISRISWIFTLELGAYLITMGMLTALLRQGRIDAGLYAAVIWAFALTLLPMSIYFMVKKGTKGRPT
ncbi:hypothetical protein FH039_05265 [Thermococcus indicus]|uniref:DUF2178 domain-containing protein n=1 Tax=Thermococcus indicus TaxID=2586643 RepID=A0A4Y5SQM8_9EURY|nr:hypothetical protein [Thermococcus indicus]QDA32350.1 hypothetical protein FH039_05265 [Thermococcus indicus]